MNSLGSVILRNGMVWEEEKQYTGVIQEVRQTLGGRSRIYSRAGCGPVPITLSSLDDQGWMSIADVDTLTAMAKDPEGCYTLQLGARSYEVYFRHYEPPVFTVTRLLIPRSVPLPDDLCLVSIKLVSYNPL